MKESVRCCMTSCWKSVRPMAGPSHLTECMPLHIHLMADGQLEAPFLAAKGDRAWKNKRMVKACAIPVLQVMEVLLGDEHTFDCWVSYQLPNGKVTAIKPKLVAGLTPGAAWCVGISAAGCQCQILSSPDQGIVWNPGRDAEILEH